MTTDPASAPAGNEPAAVPPLPRRTRYSRTATALPLSIFALLVIVTAVSWLIYDTRRDLVATAERTAVDSAFFLADHASRLFEASDLALIEASNAVTAMDWDEIAASERLWRRLHDLRDRLPYVDNVWLNDAAGELRMSTVAFPTPPSNAADRDFFVAHREPGSGLFVSRLLIGRVTNDATFLLSRRLEGPDGDLRGVVALTIDLGYFQRFYGSLNLDHQPVVSLRRVIDGTVLVHHGDTDVPEFGAMPGDEIGMISPLHDIGATAVHAYRMVQDLPLYVTVTIPLSRIREAWFAQTWIYAALGAIAALTLWPLTLTALRQARRDQEANQALERRVDERTQQLREANGQLETLFQEVHHRVKNNLQVITSLLRLQAARSKDDDTRAALRQSVDRVHAMSLVHQLLYSTHELTDIDFASYLETLTRNLQNAYGTADRIRVAIEAGDARFNLNTAIPLCLIVNEVLSNAFKHAYPDGRTGVVRVTLDRAGERWRLEIRDDGVGLADNIDRGLGLQIIRSLSRQLNGDMALSSDGGAVLTLSFPA